MVSDAAKIAIDALSREEIIGEIAKAQRSRFQGENFAYLHQRLATVDQLPAAQQHEREQHIAVDGNQLAADANKIAMDANDLSEQSNRIAKGASATAAKSYRMSALAVIVAIVAVVIALIPQCAGKP